MVPRLVMVTEPFEPPEDSEWTIISVHNGTGDYGIFVKAVFHKEIMTPGFYRIHEDPNGNMETPEILITKAQLDKHILGDEFTVYYLSISPNSTDYITKEDT